MNSESKSSAAPKTVPQTHPSFSTAFWVWVKVGLLSFGGPTGQIALMHTELVEKRRWVSDSRFLQMLNYCMLLPGPEAHQLAIYIGWLLHRTWGGIVAGVWFVLPGALLLWGVSYVYVVYGDVPWIDAIFYGLKPAVMAIVAAAVLRIGKKALKTRVMWTISALAFVAIFFFNVPFPAIVLTGGVIGLVGGIYFPNQFKIPLGHGGKAGHNNTNVISDVDAPAHVRTTPGRTARVTSCCLALWFAPLVLVGVWLGTDHTLFRESVFFSKAAVVTFGGAYAVLPYVAQQAVETHGWLSAPQMVDGLGLAETTPGPLILVLQFVGFLGGFYQPGELPPLLAATLGALLTSWMTFVPSFMFIFVGAPYMERMRDNTKLTAALSAITAVVVGVVLNLAVWFGLNVLLPETGRVDWYAAVVSVVALIGLTRWKWNIIPVVLGAGALGFIYKLIMPT
ncbi:MAG: chromate efflux transporter [Verrucomicrobia bacterium]|nr:chromate efflux transporter [Verrucomicrobiota bacterium]